MSGGVNNALKRLLIDTCGEEAKVALSDGESVAAQVTLPRGGGSAGIVDALSGLLSDEGLKVADLDAIGVVSGPGSFTGVRVGLATAKGLCEASGVKMVAVSRLVVLADAVGLRDGLVALDAGRGEVYVGEKSVDGSWREWLGGTEEVMQAASGRELVVAEAKVMELLTGAEAKLHTLVMEDVLLTVLREIESGVGDMTLVEANYVRRESDIYAKPAGR